MGDKEVTVVHIEQTKQVIQLQSHAEYAWKIPCHPGFQTRSDGLGAKTELTFITRSRQHMVPLRLNDKEARTFATLETHKLFASTYASHNTRLEQSSVRL
jgi:hypothetical protein